MTTHENGTPKTPDWVPPEPKRCPFPTCHVCETAQQAFWRHNGADMALADQAVAALGEN